MVHDRLFKLIFIPLAGLALPVFAGLIDWSQTRWPETLFVNLIFFMAAYITWNTCTAMSRYIHDNNLLEANVSTRLFLLCLLSAICSTAIALPVMYLWLQYFDPLHTNAPIARYCILSAFIAMFTVSIYEVLYLHQGQILQYKIVRQLQAERTSLEMGLLQKELEPHFVLNSFTSLYHLIKGDPERAQNFVQKLSRVYKYLLANKEREMISISEELDFIQSYYYLLQIRYDHNIELHFDLDLLPQNGMIIPCALQILVENAVKHNQFKEQAPLHIWIKRDKDWLVVENELNPKPFSIESTRIGLNNLSHRYELVSSKKVLIHKSATKFTVHLPIIKE